MWISLSRQQSNRSGPLMPSAAHSSIPPPGPPARPERRKSEEKKLKNKEQQKDSSSTREDTGRTTPSAPSFFEEINENYGSPPTGGVTTALGSPWYRSPRHHASESEGVAWTPSGPTRRSFKLAGHIPDLTTERNMLPLWLEEETVGSSRQNGVNISNRNEMVGFQDSSFESRWDSMKGRNRKRHSFPSIRPPGWEDVGQQEKRKKNKIASKTKTNFCPSFTINDVPIGITRLDNNQPAIQRLSPPVAINIEPPPVTVNIEPPPESDLELPTSNQSYNSGAFDMTELTENVDNIFSDSFLQEKEFSMSNSNLGPPSASNSPSSIPSQVSASAIQDRHLWTSSDSFICEDFSFCSGRQPREIQQECTAPQPPRSYSQLLLSHPELNDGQEFTDYDEMYTNREENLQNHHYSCISTPEQDFEGGNISLISPYLRNISENGADIPAQCQSNTGDARDNSYDLSDSLDNTISNEHIDSESSNPTIRVTNNSTRQNWIRFDNGSFEHLDEIFIDAYDNRFDDSYSHDEISCDFEHQSNFDEYRSNSIESATSPTSPTMPRNCTGSTLNLVEPRLEQVPVTYKSPLVRSYSQRGKRASKRVARTVNRKVTPIDYGKLVNPLPPIYSRAALTMGQQPDQPELDTSPTTEITDDYMNSQADKTRREQTEGHKLDEQRYEGNNEGMSTLSPHLPKRVGSLRVPRLPTMFLRRSVSLNAPKVSRGDVPFQRLPERRGSFKRAISGLGAIARSIQRRSGSFQASPTNSSHKVEKPLSSGPSYRLQRSGSIGSYGRSVPKAPRLPRRAISHKQPAAKDT